MNGAPGRSPVGRCARGDAGVVSRLAGDDIGPQRLDLPGFEHVIPWRHVALAVGHRIDKTVVAVARKGPQIERPLRIAHARAMAGRAMAREQRRALLDLLRRDPGVIVLGRGARADQREAEACGCNHFHVVAGSRALFGHQREGPHRPAGGRPVRDFHDAVENAADARQHRDVLPAVVGVGHGRRIDA